MAFKTYSKVNIWKNVLIVVCAVVSIPTLSRAINTIKSGQMSNDFLLIISMLLVTACFANFAFTYEKSALEIRKGKYLSHAATFVFMLLIATLLESIVITAKTLYPSFYTIILGFAILLYVGVVLYDLWDFSRA